MPFFASASRRRQPTARHASPSARHALPSARTAINAALLWVISGAAGLGAAAGSAAAADLDAPITATWSGIGLREWAGRISDTAGLPVVVDRRLDPDTPIRLECREEPLREVIARGAAHAGGEVATLRSSVRIVPRGTAGVVSRAEVARESRLASLPPRQRSVLAGRRSWFWPAGARPRDLLTDIATESGITLEGIDAVPHDHLPSLSLPELTLAERIDLLLAGFDRRVDWQAVTATGGKATHLPVGRIIAIDTELPPPAATAAAGTPASPTKPAAGRPPRRASADRPKPSAERHTFSLQVAAPLEDLLKAIAARMNLKLDLDRESLVRRGIAPGEIVRATVTDAARDELLDAILGPLDLDWSISGDTLRVFAEPRPER